MKKYLIIPLLLFCSQLAGQEENRGTIKVAKPYKKSTLTVVPAYIDSNGIVQILALDNKDHVMLAEKANKATMLYVSLKEGETQIPISLTSYNIMIIKNQKDIKDFKVVGKEFDTEVLSQMSQLSPGDVVYFDNIVVAIEGSKRKLGTRTFKIIE